MGIAPASHRSDGRLSSVQAWATVALLFVASIISVIDRSLLNIVVDTVKVDLGVSDVQISLLQGLAFGLFYATMGIWLGFVADRTSRRLLIVAGIGLWSLATIGSGLAQSFGSLFVARLLVGLGEAALAPAAISLIADMFPPDKRGRPIGLYLMGQAVASGVSIFVGGSLLAAAGRGAFADWPLIATLAPWRIVFVLCGLLGLVVSGAFLLTTEPRRGPGSSERLPFSVQAKAAFDHFNHNRGHLASVYMGFAICFLGAYGAFAWQFAMLSRSFAASPLAVAAQLGPLSIGFGLAGPLIGGFLVDHMVKRGGPPYVLRLLVALPLLALPSACAVLAPTLGSACIFAASLAGVVSMVGTATLSYIQSVVPGHMRGFSVSMTGLVNTLIGSAIGPFLVATMTEHVFKADASVGYSILCVACPAYIIAAACYALAGRQPDLSRRSVEPLSGQLAGDAS